MWTSSYTENLTDGCWSPTRPSVFFTTRMDGCLDAWDILYQQRAPLLSIKVSDDPLHTLKVHEGKEVVQESPEATVISVWKTPVCKRGACKQGILKHPVFNVLNFRSWIKRIFDTVN